MYDDEEEMDREFLSLLEIYVKAAKQQLLNSTDFEDPRKELLDMISYLLFNYLSALGRNVLIDSLIFKSIDEVIMEYLGENKDSQDLYSEILGSLILINDSVYNS